MKNHKKINVVLTVFTLLFLLISKSSFAQGSGKLKGSTVEERASFQTEWMKEKLHLDSVQVQKVKDINLKYALKNEPIMKSSDGKLAKFRQLKANQNEKEAELKKVFSREQFKQYEVIKDELQDKMKEKMRNQ
ncbi:hypothetical protein VB776_13610 [Arcicella sp. DC2W]|uniref:Uncharacterized protein n=1 Tax=Arcicella gelida TaxID=2984195 RepID=A0ABU5S650_9BACT|nr:hypothetical protein [Arcicella sp. DC2W]MEA5403960.1 hypothetical protein [Arcicella sp. DC2W]